MSLPAQALPLPAPIARWFQERTRRRGGRQPTPQDHSPPHPNPPSVDGRDDGGAREGIEEGCRNDSPSCAEPTAAETCTLDPTAFPDIYSTIISHCDYRTLLALRVVSIPLNHLVDACLFREVRLESCKKYSPSTAHERCSGLLLKAPQSGRHLPCVNQCQQDFHKFDIPSLQRQLAHTRLLDIDWFVPPWGDLTVCPTIVLEKVCMAIRPDCTIRRSYKSAITPLPIHYRHERIIDIVRTSDSPKISIPARRTTHIINVAIDGSSDKRRARPWPNLDDPDEPGTFTFTLQHVSPARRQESELIVIFRRPLLWERSGWRGASTPEQHASTGPASIGRIASFILHSSFRGAAEAVANPQHTGKHTIIGLEEMLKDVDWEASLEDVAAGFLHAAEQLAGPDLEESRPRPTVEILTLADYEKRVDPATFTLHTGLPKTEQ